MQKTYVLVLLSLLCLPRHIFSLEDDLRYTMVDVEDASLLGDLPALHEMRSYFEVREELANRVLIRLYLANCHESQGRFDSSAFWLNSAEELSLSSSNTCLLSEVFDARAALYSVQQQYVESYRAVQEAMHNALTCPDKEQIIWTMVRKARLFSELREFEISDSIAREALDLALEIQSQGAIKQILLDLMYNSFGARDFPIVLQTFKKLKQEIGNEASESDQIVFLAEGMQVAGRALMECQHYDSAANYLQNSIRCLPFDTKPDFAKSYMYLDLAKCFYRQGLLDQAIFHLDSLRIYDPMGDSDLNLERIHLQYLIADKEKQTAAAYAYLQAYDSIKSTLQVLNEEERSEVLKADARSVIRTYERRNLSLASTNSQLKFSRYLLMIGLLMISLLFYLGYRLWRSRHRRQVVELLQGKNLLDNYQNLVTRLQEEAKLQKAEITAKTLERSKMLQMLNQLKEIQKTGTDLNLSRLRSIIREIDLFGQDWKTFEASFALLHADFFHKLKTNHPNLTENELRHIAYLKLGMTNREVANMVGINQSSVKIARYRINKKINVSGKSLAEYITQI